ncbi:collagen alpha-1(I) chain-like isoform X9 [Hemicordylus capensis]|uniref:collagen alpha-1(I) chain-like isoform X9 n=1 Tax=Hemicordylus capensis TaxID=884348 RepID=UPI002304C9C7|nr:collagen alpha-1(I) chain-like isoform X9 [Hemicordylus capensis]
MPGSPCGEAGHMSGRGMQRVGWRQHVRAELERRERSGRGLRGLLERPPPTGCPLHQHAEGDGGREPGAAGQGGAPQPGLGRPAAPVRGAAVQGLAALPGGRGAAQGAGAGPGAPPGGPAGAAAAGGPLGAGEGAGGPAAELRQRAGRALSAEGGLSPGEAEEGKRPLGQPRFQAGRRIGHQRRGQLWHIVRSTQSPWRRPALQSASSPVRRAGTQPQQAAAVPEP